jgi:hypothetical protein
MFRKALVCTLAFAALAVPSFAAVSIHCPNSNNVVAHSIPHSVNSYFTATSDGVDFWSYGAGWVKGLPLIAAQVSEFSGSWSFTCGYGQSGSVFENLTSGNSAVYANCKFANGSQSCQGGIDQCVLSCPSQPVLVNPQALAKPRK